MYSNYLMNKYASMRYNRNIAIVANMLLKQAADTTNAPYGDLGTKALGVGLAGSAGAMAGHELGEMAARNLSTPAWQSRQIMHYLKGEGMQLANAPQEVQNTVRGLGKGVERLIPKWRVRGSLVGAGLLGGGALAYTLLNRNRSQPQVKKSV